jgi:hypothetical protein
VWNQKRKDEASVEPEERRPGEFGTGREETRRVWHRKSKQSGGVELKERVQGLLPKITKIKYGRGI